jgi:hypothetical protein
MDLNDPICLQQQQRKKHHNSVLEKKLCVTKEEVSQHKFTTTP